jgi:type VII secretion protein EccB
MATRRDQLQSYQFLTQRVISAFVMRETDPAQSPLRRGIGAVFAGIMITVLVAAGFGVYGILTKVGTSRWRADGSVVVEKESGASFVYFGGVLHPTLNYASAMLAAGRTSPAVFRVSGESLAGVPRGVMVGIPGAPNSLPEPRHRLDMPWTICATPDPGSPDGGGRVVTLAVGAAPSGGRRLDDAGLLVREATTEATFLIWHGRRHRVEESRTVVPALFGAVAADAPIGTSWLITLPSGQDIAPIPLSDRGRPSSAAPGRKIGDVLVVSTGSGPQHYLVLDDGLAPITDLQKAILAATSLVQPRQVQLSEVTAVRTSARVFRSGGEIEPPATVPRLEQPGPRDLVCAETGDAGQPPTLWVGTSVTGLRAAIPSAVGQGVNLADRVFVPPGQVAVVRALGAPEAPSGAFNIITDLAIRFPVPSAEVLQMLGYSPDQAVDVPASLVTRVPAGPTLDPEAALQPASARAAG